MNPQFPVYIVSKGRWESRLTTRCLDKMGVPYRMVIEEQEWPQYASAIDKRRLLVLDKKYQRDYDPCDGLGDSKTKGSGPARNFVWDHALHIGAEWHWCVDDNIRDFFRWNRNMRIRAGDGTMLRCMEDFVLRYENVGMAGPAYKMFAPDKQAHLYKPFHLNTRVYSCNLIRTDLPFRWRARYNEDTDLSLRILKAKWCTVLFMAFLADKMATLTMRGGNADLYGKDDAKAYAEKTVAKSRLICALHPDVCDFIVRWGRAHHHVDYRKHFKHGLVRKPGIEFPDGNDEFGMNIVQCDVSTSRKIPDVARPGHRRGRVHRTPPVQAS